MGDYRDADVRDWFNCPAQCFSENTVHGSRNCPAEFGIQVRGILHRLSPSHSVASFSVTVGRILAKKSDGSQNVIGRSSGSTWNS